MGEEGGFVAWNYFFVTFRYWRFNPSMMFAVYMIFWISSENWKKGRKIVVALCVVNAVRRSKFRYAKCARQTFMWGGASATGRTMVSVGKSFRWYGQDHKKSMRSCWQQIQICYERAVKKVYAVGRKQRFFAIFHCFPTENDNFFHSPYLWCYLLYIAAISYIFCFIFARIRRGSRHSHLSPKLRRIS